MKITDGISRKDEIILNAAKTAEGQDLLVQIMHDCLLAGYMKDDPAIVALHNYARLLLDRLAKYNKQLARLVLCRCYDLADDFESIAEEDSNGKYCGLDWY